MIEIFDEREISAEGTEPDAEALEIISSLGLKTETSGERISYPRPNAQQWFVLQTLFPERTLLENYDAGCIPLRVLKEIRSYKAEHPGHHLVVFHLEKAAIKDPVLCACTQESVYWATGSSDPAHYRLVARWGDALEPWDELANKGMRIARQRVKDACEVAIRRLTLLREVIGNIELKNNSVPTLNLSNMPEGL